LDESSLKGGSQKSYSGKKKILLMTEGRNAKAVMVGKEEDANSSHFFWIHHQSCLVFVARNGKKSMARSKKKQRGNKGPNDHLPMA
jgi:hypothetical protein